MSCGWLLLLAAAGLAAGAVCGWRSQRLWLPATLAGALAGLAAAVTVLAGGGGWDWQPAFLLGGERVHLRLDGLSAFFLALLSTVGGAATVYSSEYWNERSHPSSSRTGRGWWNGLLGCLGLVLLASNGLHFLIAWELFTVCGYFLITLERSRREVRAAGWLYLAASHAGTLCLFAFFSVLSAQTGSWDLGPMGGRAELAPLFWLALIGFSVKAGVFPLHIWLPSGHANAPSHVSAMLSGVAIKMGIYGLIRFSGWLPVPAAGGWVVAGLGVISAVLGVAFALGQHDLKRLLAYHSVENIGIILIGLGFALIAARHGDAAWGKVALAGGLLHVWNHGLFKSLLFLGAGSVLHATHTREMSRLGGLWRRMPWTAGLFGLGAAAIAGLPPLNGFVSEWLVYLGLFDLASGGETISWSAIPAAVLLGVTGALALACFVKVCGVVFLGLPRSLAAERAHECGWRMRSGMLALGAACAAIGLAPGFFWPALAAASSAWLPGWQPGPAPESLWTLGYFHLALAGVGAAGALVLWRRALRNGMRRAVTWDCGYAAPTPRMQYTAGSFAGIITGWFEWILCPRRHGSAPAGFFPAEARCETHTPETVLENVIEPAGGLVMRVSTAVRRLQHGRLQAYILYLLAGVIALALLALWGGGAP
jgi:hydrogenase-4 component B